MRITKRCVEAQKPSDKPEYLWDSGLSGFGVKTLPSGRKTYIVQYRVGGRAGRTRRISLGVHGNVTTELARVEAKKLLGQVAIGIDPLADKDAAKNAKTVEDILKIFLAEHVDVKLRPGSIEAYHNVAQKKLPPSFKKMPIKKVVRQDVARLHHAMHHMPCSANKTLAVLSKFFNWAEKYGYRDDHTNPCRHVQKYKETPRQRFLSPEEQQHLGDAFNKAEHEKLATIYAIDALRVICLTGARLREILHLKWDYVDLGRGVLNLPTSKTGPKTIYLNEAAIEILHKTIRQVENPFVFCGLIPGKPIHEIQKAWQRIRRIAGLEDVRIHDLRHTFASVAVMNGMSLPMIGALLGHSQPRTTARYAHIASDPMREAAERIGKQISPHF